MMLIKNWLSTEKGTSLLKYLKYMYDGRKLKDSNNNISNQTIGGFQLIDENGEVSHSPDEVFIFMIIYGAEKLGREEFIRYINKTMSSCSVEGICSMIEKVFCMDAKASKIIFEFINCAYCDAEKCSNCVKNGECDCDSTLNKVGSFMHQVMKKEKLQGFDRCRIIIEMLHGSLRPYEKHISYHVYMGTQLGTNIDDTNKWIHKNISKNLSVSVKDWVDNKNKNLTSPSDIKTNGYELDYMKFILKTNEYIDFLFENNKEGLKKNYFENEKLIKTQWEIMISERLSLWCSQYQDHKNRYFYYCQKEESSIEWKNVVDNFFKKIKMEIEEYGDPLENKRNYSKYYSTTLLLIVYMGKYGIPKDNIEKDKLFENIEDNELIDSENEEFNEKDEIEETNSFGKKSFNNKTKEEVYLNFQNSMNKKNYVS